MHLDVHNNYLNTQLASCFVGLTLACGCNLYYTWCIHILGFSRFDDVLEK